MAEQVVIIHGWSDKGVSFHTLAEYINGLGLNLQAKDIWLTDYISLENDVRVEDVAKRLEAVIQEKLSSGELRKPFHLIVHSTGGLVARQWLSTYYSHRITECPVHRLVMLAPANFGSKLATLGQSMLGRIVKGWKNWFHTGKAMLDDLELGSLFQWELAKRDLFAHDEHNPSIYGEHAVWPFVLIGSHPYLGTLHEITNENGSDGTVRVAAGNLNVKGATLDFVQDDEHPIVKGWLVRHDKLRFPLAVLADRTHSSITKPELKEPDSSRHDELGHLLKQALTCDWQTYQGLAHNWEVNTSAKTAELASSAKKTAELFGKTIDPHFFDQFFMLNVHVIDDHGRDILDYFLEFYGPEEDLDDESTIYFHKEVLTDVHVNQYNSSYRTLFINKNKLNGFYERIKTDEKVLNMSLSISPPGNNISYFDDIEQGAKGHFTVHRQDGKDIGSQWLTPNTTHFIEIIVPRMAHLDVCKLNFYAKENN